MTEPFADYSVPEVAKLLGKSDDRVRSMARDGQIGGAYQLIARGRWRFRRRDFDQWHAGLGPQQPDDPNRLEPPSRRSMAHRNRRAS